MIGPPKSNAGVSVGVERARVGGEPGSSLYRLLGGRTRPDGRGFAPVAHLEAWAVYAARALCGAPAGAKGLSVVSIHQIASAGLRAMSIRATSAPRCLPRRVLVRW